MATFGWQIPFVPASPSMSHHSGAGVPASVSGPPSCGVAQSVSVVHVYPHAPVAVSQRGPAWLPVQSVSLVHLPHVPAAVQ